MAVRGLQRRKSVQEVLLERKIITEDKVKAADEDAAKNRKSFQQAVLDLKFLSKTHLLKVLSEEWGVKAVDLSQMEIDKDIVGLIPESVAHRHVAVPFVKEEGVLFIAMADPRDFFACEDIHLRTGLEVEPYLALPQDITSALESTYGEAHSEALTKLVEQAQEASEAPPDSEGVEIAREGPKTDIAEVDASAPEVEKFANAIILAALNMKASDIHVEPWEDPNAKTSKVLIRYRVDGMLRPGTFNIPWAFRNAIIAKIKIMTNSMNITERRIPQSGRIQILVKGHPVEFRVEMIPTVYGESCVMRILDRKSVEVDISKLGFMPEVQDKFLNLLSNVGGKKNFGMILVCGPTGSGKSTTLYGALNFVNRPDIKILTAENPVEYNLDGIIQVPVNPEIKLGADKVFDFASALRSFLRLDPDVIMVGEVRDAETAHIAMEAAMTGHLVLSTIHTNDAPSAVSRIVEMGLPAYMVASTLKAIMAQRLSRRVCPDCKKPHSPTPEEIAVFKDYEVELPKDIKIFKGDGCPNCGGSGLKGRLGLHELMIMSDALRAQCLKDVSSDHIREIARKEGMRTIIQDGLEKVKLGLTTVREVLGGAAENDADKKEPKK